MKNNLIQSKIDVIDNKVGIMRVNDIDYIPLTDLSKVNYVVHTDDIKILLFQR